MKRFIPAVLAVFVIGIALGAGGCALWERTRPEPSFLSFDTRDIDYIELQGRDTFMGRLGSNLNPVYITDRERIDYILDLLSNFTYLEEEEHTTPRCCGTCISLHTTAGDVTWVYFDTYDDGRPDALSWGNPEGGSTKYITASGYFSELSKMPSTDPS